MKVWNEAVRTYTSITNARWLILGVLVGIVSGIGAIIFFASIEGIKFLLLHEAAGLTLPAPAGEELFHTLQTSAYRPWLIPIFTTLVGLLSGWLTYKYMPETRYSGTDGTDAMIKNFHQQGGVMRPIVPLLKAGIAILNIATGGSAGREGPISLLGAGCGSWIAQKFNLSAKERRILLLAGAAGGLGAIFRAPLGGALTAVEVIYREDFEAEAILPAVISSVVSYSLFTLAFGTEPIFGIPHFTFTDPRELPFYAILAVVCAASGWFWIKTFTTVKYKIFWPMTDKLGFVWTMGFAGLLMGLIGWAFPQLLCGGYGWLELAILGKLTIGTMLAIIVGKAIATSIVLGSGISGGMFAPALFAGGLSGGIVGYAAHAYIPTIVTQPGAYVLVGMAAFFAGVANAPIGPMIMVCELTKGYGLLAPLMMASAITIVLARNFSLYENQVDNKFESPAHIQDTTINILEDLRVSDFYQPELVTTLEEGTSFHAITDIITDTNELYFPVRNHEDNITGILSVQNLRKVLFEDCLFDVLVAKDVAGKPVVVHPDDDLYTALMLFVDSGYGQIPVIDHDDPKKILGQLAREDVFAAYAKTLKELKKKE
ncbi:MAG: chloride channel protein [Desulfoplanes sp.]|nr:chloride channel protein [Desulfoplanes sp.]